MISDKKIEEMWNMEEENRKIKNWMNMIGKGRMAEGEIKKYRREVVKKSRYSEYLKNGLFL